MKIGAKIVSGFLAVLAVMLISGGISYYLLGQVLVMSNENQESALPMLTQTNKLAVHSAQKVAAIRGFVITGKTSFLDEYKALDKEDDEISKKLMDGSLTPKGKEMAAEAKRLDDAYQKIAFEKAVPLAQAGKKEELFALMANELAPAAAATAKHMEAYEKYRLDRFNTILDQEQDQIEQTMKMSLISLLIALLVGGAVAFVITRMITRPLAAAVHHLDLMAANDFTQRIDGQLLAAKDETGVMARAMDKMILSMREIIKQLGTSSEQMAASSEELLASADQSAAASNEVAISITDVAKGAAGQVSIVGDTKGIVEQIAIGIHQVADNATNVAGVAEKTSNAAQEGGKAVNEATNQMQSIEQSVANTAVVVGKLGERSKEIGQIVDTIASISGQTNLLALNAAIEAARAGEQGRGFAVVAEEVRKLAEQSQAAAQQIAGLIKEIQNDTDAAVTAMEVGNQEVKKGTEVVTSAGQTFQQIVSLINDLSYQVTDISAAVQEIASSSEQIVQSVQKIDGISNNVCDQAEGISAATEEQAASMEEIATASRALANMAETLRQVVAKFQV